MFKDRDSLIIRSPILNKNLKFLVILPETGLDGFRNEATLVKTGNND